MAKEATIVATRPARRGAGGRPTREEAVRRDARLLEVATKLFMERGFESTSIDAVAETAGVSKPTVYARYRDKRDLFTAVLRATIQRWLAPAPNSCGAGRPVSGTGKARPGRGLAAWGSGRREPAAAVCRPRPDQDRRPRNGGRPVPQSSAREYRQIPRHRNPSKDSGTAERGCRQTVPEWREASLRTCI